MCFFFNDTATTEIYTLSLHDALPILRRPLGLGRSRREGPRCDDRRGAHVHPRAQLAGGGEVHVRAQRRRSEEHTSELQSRQYLVCRLLLEKKNITTMIPILAA